MTNASQDRSTAPKGVTYVCTLGERRIIAFLASANVLLQSRLPIPHHRWSTQTAIPPRSAQTTILLIVSTHPRSASHN
jgi:hypothetical protein